MIPMERTHEYHGVYHVLGGALSPIDGVDPEDLKIAELFARVAGRTGTRRCGRSCSRPTRPPPARPPRCTSPRSCARARPDVTVTRLASGLPVGSDLEYADEVTLGKAFAGRRRGRSPVGQRAGGRGRLRAVGAGDPANILRRMST